MSKVLIIGGGSVGTVTTHKCAQFPEYFDEICLASRNISKCEKIASQIKKEIKIAQLNADNKEEVIKLIQSFKPNIVINVALPYQNLSIMEACLETGVDYIDTACYEPPEEAKYSYTWQWKYHEQYKQKRIMALLGCGFDPGVTNVMVAYAKKHYFDTIENVDIIDCNAGDHGLPFATNFNPEINLRELDQPGKYYDNGKWIEIQPMSISKKFNFDEIGEKDIYLIYHEELETLTKHFPEIKRIRFWMTFSQNYLNHLRAFHNVGLTRVDPIEFEGHKIVPIKFLKALLPDPATLGPITKGKTNIGCLIEGIKNGKKSKYYIYQICDHEETYKESYSQAVAYTAGVPPVIGATLIITNKWKDKGVFNCEQFDPDPFMNLMPKFGLPWKEKFNYDIEF